MAPYGDACAPFDGDVVADVVLALRDDGDRVYRLGQLRRHGDDEEL